MPLQKFLLENFDSFSEKLSLLFLKFLGNNCNISTWKLTPQPILMGIHPGFYSIFYGTIFHLNFSFTDL